MIDWKQALKKIAKAIGISSKAAEEKRSPEPNRPQVRNIHELALSPRIVLKREVMYFMPQSKQ